MSELNETSIQNERPQPHSLDVERAILASILRSGDVMRVHDNRVDVDTFYSHIHREIFKSMLQVQKAKLHLDMITVCHQLSKNGHLEDVGGEVFIAETWNSIATDAHLEDWIKIHLEFHAKRLLINKCSETLLMCYDEQPTALETFNAHRGGLGEVEGFSCGKVQKSTGDKIKDYVLFLKELQAGNCGHIVKFGIDGVDDYIQLMKKQLLVLGGLPNTGKTRFILCDAIGKMRKGISSAIFSWENTSEIIIAGMTSILSGIPQGYMTQKGKLTKKQLAEIGNAVQFLNDNKKLLCIFGKGDYIHSASGISAETRRIQDNHGNLQAIYVDHLQNMLPEDGLTGEQAVANSVHRVSNIGAEHDLATILLTQFNRDKVRDIGGRRPVLSDMKGSSAIEEDADYVVFLHRKDRKKLGNVLLEFYTEKVRGTNMFDQELAFNTFSGKISGIIAPSPRYTEQDQPQPWRNKLTKGD